MQTSAFMFKLNLFLCINNGPIFKKSQKTTTLLLQFLSQVTCVSKNETTT